MDKIRLLVFPAITVFFIFLLAVPSFFASVESPTPTAPPTNKAELCRGIGAVYDDTLQECQTTEGRCRAIGGVWDPCASPCRMQPDATSCIERCDMICKLN